MKKDLLDVLDDYVDLDDVETSFDADGVSICGTVTVGGMKKKICIPRKYTQWEDILREAKNAGALVEAGWKKLWRWVSGKK